MVELLTELNIKENVRTGVTMPTDAHNSQGSIQTVPCHFEPHVFYDGCFLVLPGPQAQSLCFNVLIRYSHWVPGDIVDGK